MSNVYDMTGKKKVIFTSEVHAKITYKEIMELIIKYASEEKCAEIFTYGGIDLCPSEIFGPEKIDVKKEEDLCNYESIGCSKCWENAIKTVKELEDR